MKKRPMLMLMDWEQQTIVSMYFCVKKSEEESFLDESQIYLWNNYDSILTLKILIHPGWYLWLIREAKTIIKLDL